MVEWAQSLIVVDDKDNFIRYAPRKECHTGEGVRHRGITLLIFNKDKKILLQKRKHEVFDNIWDLAGATHPIRVKDSDETYEQSGIRCMQDEWGATTELEICKRHPHLFASNIAVTVFDSVTAISQSLPTILGQFIQPVNTEPEAGRARKATWEL